MYNPQMAPFQPQNIDSTTSMLMGMKEKGQLAQYMQQHKNDPNMVALAMSVNTMYDQAHAPKGAPQPTVVDQEIAKMGAHPQGQAQAMPEDTGIGTLPQPTMQKMAKGGIVAFAGGGTPNSLTGDIPGFQAGNMYANAMSNYPQEAVAPATDVVEAANQASLRYTGFPLSAADRVMVAKRAADIEAQKAAGSASAAAGKPFDPSAYAGAQGPSTVAASASTPSSAQPVPIAAPTAPNTGGITSIAPRPTPNVPAAPRPAIVETPEAQMARYNTFRNGMNDTDPQASQVKELGALGVKNQEEAQARLVADNAAMADMFKGKEANIADRAANILKQSDTNIGLAFLNAGLSIMSTPGSLATAIGKGAKVGTESFAAGLDKINAAKEHLAAAQDKMEDLKINHAQMSAKEMRDSYTAIGAAKADALRMGLAGLRDAGAKNDKAALTIFGDISKERISAATNATHIQAAGIAANATSPQERIINKLGGGDFAKGYETFKQEDRIPKLYEAYQKAATDPMKGAEFTAKFPTWDTYLAGMTGGKGKILEDDTTGKGSPMRTR